MEIIQEFYKYQETQESRHFLPKRCVRSRQLFEDLSIVISLDMNRPPRFIKKHSDLYAQ